jgi:hypothetical protein
MRQLMLAAGALCAAGGLVWQASAQVNTMPGQVVGTGFNVSGTVQNVGSAFPRAAPQGGQPINMPAESAMMRPYDPAHPYDVFKGTNLSTDQLAAPIPGLGDQSMLSKLKDKIKSVLGMTGTSTPQRPTYFPSLSRRNKERAQERLWRRD